MVAKNLIFDKSSVVGFNVFQELFGKVVKMFDVYVDTYDFEKRYDCIDLPMAIEKDFIFGMSILPGYAKDECSYDKETKELKCKGRRLPYPPISFRYPTEKRSYLQGIVPDLVKERGNEKFDVELTQGSKTICTLVGCFVCELRNDGFSLNFDRVQTEKETNGLSRGGV